MALRFLERSLTAVHALLSGISRRLSALEGRAPAPGGIVLDIGASVGAFAIAVALHFPLVRIFAVEPAPENYGYLLWNIRANNVTHRVWPLRAALRGMADPASVVLRYSPVWPTATASCPAATEAECDFEEYSVQAATLAGLMEALGLRRVDWLNLDCEGCEWRLGADNDLLPLLLASVGLVTAELHPAAAVPRATAATTAAKGLVGALCTDERVREKLLWGLELRADTVPTGFMGDGLLCAAPLGPPWAAPAAGVVGPAGSHPEAPLLQPPHGPARGRIFLLSSFSHDDLDQWPLIPHFMAHYRHRLGLDPEHFLLILHSDSRNVSGLVRMAEWFNREHGVVHTFPVMEPYSSFLHMRVKHEILHRHVGPQDWVMQVDADEFVFFPGGRSAREALEALDARGENVHFGLMVDRIAASGNIDAVPSNRTTLFAQYPLNCALTLLLQSSDVRKASAYRGYLRTTTGNHNVLGLNESLAARAPLSPAVLAMLLLKIRRVFGDRIFLTLPGSERTSLPAVRATPEHATAYHFKWVRGLAAKLRRRAETEVYTNGQYSELRSVLEGGSRLNAGGVRKFCNLRDLPGPAEPVRALSSRELIMLFMNIRNEQLTDLLRRAGVPEAEEPEYNAELLQRNVHFGIARETNLPVD